MVDSLQFLCGAGGSLRGLPEAGERPEKTEEQIKENFLGSFKIQAKSLKEYCRKYGPEIAVRTSMSDYRGQEWMTNVPLYVLTSYLRNIS